MKLGEGGPLEEGYNDSQKDGGNHDEEKDNREEEKTSSRRMKIYPIREGCNNNKNTTKQKENITSKRERIRQSSGQRQP